MVIRYTAGLTQADSWGTPLDNSWHSGVQYAEDGSVVAAPPRSEGETEPPPPPVIWLLKALVDLHRRYPNDGIEAVMLFRAIDTRTGLPIYGNPSLDSGPSDRGQFRYLPRIKCRDCTGKLYIPGPGKSLENFEVHLNSRVHRGRVQKRLDASKAKGQPSEEVEREEMDERHVVASTRKATNEPVSEMPPLKKAVCTSYWAPNLATATNIPGHTEPQSSAATQLPERPKIPRQHEDPVDSYGSSPPEDSLPPPPEWLVSLADEMRQKLESKYDRFEPTMHWTQPADSFSDRVWEAVPMMLCYNCHRDNRLHKPGPGQTLGDFEAHLKDIAHKRRTSNLVAQRKFRQKLRERREEAARQAQLAAQERSQPLANGSEEET